MDEFVARDRQLEIEGIETGAKQFLDLHFYVNLEFVPSTVALKHIDGVVDYESLLDELFRKRLST